MRFMNALSCFSPLLFIFGNNLKLVPYSIIDKSDLVFILSGVNFFSKTAKDFSWVAVVQLDFLVHFASFICISAANNLLLYFM